MSRYHPPPFDTNTADAARDRLIAAAIDEYLKAPGKHGVAANFTVSNALDYALRIARHWGGRGGALPECLLFLALAFRRGEGAVRACAVALRHAVAALAIDLPLPGAAGATEGEEGEH